MNNNQKSENKNFKKLFIEKISNKFSDKKKVKKVEIVINLAEMIKE